MAWYQITKVKVRPERLEVPKEAENEDRETSGYIAVLACPGG